MYKAARRAAKSAWSERKSAWAVVSVTIGPRVWVKLTPDAGALENRLGFMLRQGGGRGLAPGMAEAYAARPEPIFTTCETLKDDLGEMARERIGAARLAHWAEALGATPF